MKNCVLGAGRRQIFRQSPIKPKVVPLSGDIADIEHEILIRRDRSVLLGIVKPFQLGAGPARDRGTKRLSRRQDGQQSDHRAK